MAPWLGSATCSPASPTALPASAPNPSNIQNPGLFWAGGMGYNSDVSEMCMLDEIRAKREEIYAIARRHKAEKLWAFGSCARKEVTA